MPIFSLTFKPDTYQQWQIYQQIITKMQNKADIFSLIEISKGLDYQLNN